AYDRVVPAARGARGSGSVDRAADGPGDTGRDRGAGSHPPPAGRPTAAHPAPGQNARGLTCRGTARAIRACATVPVMRYLARGPAKIAAALAAGRGFPPCYRP